MKCAIRIVYSDCLYLKQGLIIIARSRYVIVPMEEYHIDINCDVGEGVVDENLLYPYISSCNIACGGHTGTIDSIKASVADAIRYGVRIGAHPSYPDPVNFGRASMAISNVALAESIHNQLERLEYVLNIHNEHLHHIKPHGALYNDLAKDLELSVLFLDILREYRSRCSLYVPSGSLLEGEAIRQGYRIKREAFADRNYNRDLSLVPRTDPNAIIGKPEAVLSHLISMVKNRKVKTIQGEELDMDADTYCIHGDTPNSLQILAYLSKELPKQNIYIRS